MSANLNSNVRITTSPGKVIIGQALNSNIGTRITGAVTRNMARKASPTKLRTSASKPGKVSGYTPLMMQRSIAPQNRLSSIGNSNGEILRPTQSTYQPAKVSNYQSARQSTFQPKGSQYRQARELLLQPGFEATAQTQNIKQSQYHKYTSDFKNQGDDLKVGQADMNIQNYQSYNINNMSGAINTTGGAYQGLPGALSTYINPNSAGMSAANNFRNAQSAEYIGELEKQLGEQRLEGNHNRRNLVAMERQLEQFQKENKYLQAENANLLTELQNM